MTHYGDIKTLSGSALPLVDVIIGGSPCQDLSAAGKRAGLAGERSNLFLEQIRIAKEMQNATDGVYPRYMVWENVPGALSSNRGEDFRQVLQEIIGIQENRPIPRPEKWRTSGCILGDGYSVAWRILDAKFWGVPQRRCRIALVADFAGQSAPEILFIRRGLQGNPTQAEKAGQAGAGTADPGAGTAVYGMRQNSANARSDGIQRDAAPTLKADHPGLIVLDNHPQDGRIGMSKTGNAQPLDAKNGTGGNNGPLVLCIGNGQKNQSISDVATTLSTMHDQSIIYRQSGLWRLTPLECERLQGYPDGWTDIGDWTDDKGRTRKSSDAARYKALGNSIALPPWKWVLKRISAQFERDATMGSLFDGIGGFPLLWEQINGKGSCLWASEIEPFCVAVTKRRFKK